MNAEQKAAWRAVNVAAAGGDVTALAILRVQAQWVVAGIDREGD